MKDKKEKKCTAFSQYTESLKVSEKKKDEFKESLKIELKPLQKKKAYKGKYL